MRFSTIALNRDIVTKPIIPKGTLQFVVAIYAPEFPLNILSLNVPFILLNVIRMMYPACITFASAF